MVHNVSNSHRGKRKRSQKSRCYPASTEESLVSNWTGNGGSGDGSNVPVREQVAYNTSDPVLPSGFEEGLYQLLANEMAYHPRTDYLFSSAVCEDKIDAGMRDEAVFNLRFLHKFHNLDPACFAYAVNMTDRFLARVKVKPKYMACLATAAYLIAVKMVEERENWPDPDKLVRIARCGGSASDLARMEAIIRVKLRCSANDASAATDHDGLSGSGSGSLEAAVTPLHFLALLRPLFQCEQSYQRAVGDLETCLCCAAMYSFRPALLALGVARRYLLLLLLSPSTTQSDSGLGDQPALLVDRLLQLMEIPQSDVALCAVSVEAEARRVRSRRRSLSLSATWPGGLLQRRPRYRRMSPLTTPRQQQLQQLQMARSRQLAGCTSLDSIREEWLEA